MMKKVDVSNENFGCILNCAVRYAIGRQTYMPGLVVDYIRPLLPYVTNKTLLVFDQDITEQDYHEGRYGDVHIDEPMWRRFHAEVISEELKRGLKPYRDPHTVSIHDLY